MARVNFRMLIIAREARGLTQAELVEKISSLTQGNYSRMEKGILNVPDDTLVNISNELKFPIKFFYKDNPIKDQAEYYYRKRLTMPRKHQIKLEANFDLLRIWIESLLTDVEIPEFDIPTIEVEGQNSPATIARKIRYFLGMQKGPIDRLVYNLEKHGILVYFLKGAPEKFDGTTIVTQTGQHILVVNDNSSNDRKRFTIAHEFGHIIMHLPYSPIVDAYRDLESEANEFASEFLMPELDIRRDLINLKFSLLSDLKSFWKVSKASIIRRAYDLSFIDKSKYTNMMIELSRIGERKKEKFDVELDKPSVLQLILDTFFKELNYSREELYELIGISSEDYDYFLMGKEPSKVKMRIAI